MYTTFSNKKGFTVLEFLVVIAMMAIIIALVLVGLSRFRSQSRDQSKVSDVQRIAIGLEQFRDICGTYPENLTGTETCDPLDDQGKTIADILPEVIDMDFNEPNSSFLYAGIPTQCSGFHIGVKLENEASSFNKSGQDSQIISKCGNATSGFDAENDDFIFDIYKN